MHPIRTIAHRLNFQCRFAGDCRRFYSVAEHSVHMAREAKERGASRPIVLATLLHDAPEHCTGDLIPYVKAHPEIKPVITRMEKAEWAGLQVALGIQPHVVQLAKSPMVKDYDTAILAAEAATVAFPQDGWKPYDKLNGLHRAFHNRITRATLQHENNGEFHWRDEFIDMFQDLTVVP